jgi:hypothetical protein
MLTGSLCQILEVWISVWRHRVIFVVWVAQSERPGFAWSDSKCTSVVHERASLHRHYGSYFRIGDNLSRMLSHDRPERVFIGMYPPAIATHRVQFRMLVIRYYSNRHF